MSATLAACAALLVRKDVLVAATVVGVTALGLWLWRTLSYDHVDPPSVPDRGDASQKVIVYIPKRLPPSIVSGSPFCVKLVAWLRMSGVPHEVRPGSLLKAPKGKIPYIKHGDHTIGDSQLIIDFLTRTFFTADGAPTYPVAGPAATHPYAPWGSLTPTQQAVSTCVQRAMEEHAYHLGVYYNWVKSRGNEASWAISRDRFLDFMPPLVRMFIAPGIRRSLQAALKAHGLGRHSEKDMLALVDRDFAAASAFLADKPFLTGDRPTEGDAALFGLLEGVLYQPRDTPLRTMAGKYTNLVKYTERVRTTYFPDQVRDDNAQVFAERKA